MCWMCNMMLVFFSCSTSKFWVVSFRVGIPIWAVAGHHPLGGFSRGFIKEWSNLDLLDPLGWGEEGPWIHMFRTRFHTQKKKQFQDVQVPRPDMFISQASNSCFFLGGVQVFPPCLREPLAPNLDLFDLVGAPVKKWSLKLGPHDSLIPSYY